MVDIAAADEETAPQAVAPLSGLTALQWALRPRHTPGRAGRTVRAYADLRRPPLTGGFDAGSR